MLVHYGSRQDVCPPQPVWHGNGGSPQASYLSTHGVSLVVVSGSHSSELPLGLPKWPHVRVICLRLTPAQGLWSLEGFF